MNCKQGDIAQIVRSFGDWRAEACLGAILRCDELCADAPGGPAWRFTPLSPTVAVFARNLISDSCLRPLPGDLTPETTKEQQPCTE